MSRYEQPPGWARWWCDRCRRHLVHTTSPARRHDTVTGDKRPLRPISDAAPRGGVPVPDTLPLQAPAYQCDGGLVQPSQRLKAT